MPRGPQRQPQPGGGPPIIQNFYTTNQPSGQRGAYGRRRPGWELRQADWGGMEDPGVIAGQASWTKVDAPTYERQGVGAGPRQQWLAEQVGISWGKHKSNQYKRRNRPASPRSVWPPVGAGGGAAPAAAAPQQQQQGPRIAGALPAAGQSSPWAGGGRPMTQAGAPVGTYVNGRGPVDPNQPALPVGGSTGDYTGTPAQPMGTTSGPGVGEGAGTPGGRRVTTFRRTTGGRRPGVLDYSGAIETTATDKMSSGLGTSPGNFGNSTEPFAFSEASDDDPEMRWAKAAGERIAFAQANNIPGVDPRLKGTNRYQAQVAKHDTAWERAQTKTGYDQPSPYSDQPLRY